MDAVNIILDIPEDALFTQDQKPITASIQITPKPGSDITDNRKKIEGIVIDKDGEEALRYLGDLIGQFKAHASHACDAVPFPRRSSSRQGLAPPVSRTSRSPAQASSVPGLRAMW